MGKLYIFGNGLDLHYGLKTSPKDYLQFLKQERIYNETSNAAEIFLNYNVNWSDFEQEIAYIDLLNPVVWKISYFEKDAEVFYNAEKLSFKNKISFFQW